MRLMFAALLILSLLGSACTNVDSAGEVVVDVSAGGDVGSDVPWRTPVREGLHRFGHRTVRQRGGKAFK